MRWGKSCSGGTQPASRGYEVTALRGTDNRAEIKKKGDGAAEQKTPENKTRAKPEPRFLLLSAAGARRAVNKLKNKHKTVGSKKISSGLDCECKSKR